MKKCIKKILVLACVAVLAVSSMTAMAAEARAVACPKFCGGTVYTTREIHDLLTWREEVCPHDNTKRDTINVYNAYDVTKCTNCTYTNSVYVKHEERVCNHQ